MRTLAVERPPRSALPKLFAALLPLIYAIELVAARGPRASASDALALAITVDLTIVVPLLYWLLVVRPSGASAGRLAGVFAVSLIGARLVLPPEQRQYLALARYLALPAEAALAAWIAWRVRRFGREVSAAGAALDVPERIREALLDAMPYRATAEIISTELSLLWFAVLSWRRSPHVPVGMRAFSGHRRSGSVGILAALIAATAVEAVPLHFLLRAWSPRMASALSALSLLAAVWTLGLLRSIQLRPSLLGPGSLVVRCGLRWTVEIPLDAIAEARTVGGDGPRTAPGFLRATVAAQPNVLLLLRRPLRASGMYGTSRDVTCVAFTADDRADLAAALSSSCPI